MQGDHAGFQALDVVGDARGAGQGRETVRHSCFGPTGKIGLASMRLG
jgi:hypothetical protein